ncbi:MAG TPA: protein translocase subunit SecD, partial [Candidatus Marinimicrobia bacterium]|nr:protein translocase subunit SecD [Candidatus Neomarinimicrobiota bacterium]
MITQNNKPRIFIILVIFLVAVWALWPTIELQFFPPDDEAEIEALKKEAIKLGLDLQGGASFLLEVDIPTLVENLAVSVKPQADSLFAAILADAKKSDDQETFISRFVQSATENNIQLRRHFEGLGSNNIEIETGLNSAADDAINQVLEILQNRVDEFGVSEPTIQKQGSHRIIVELAGVTDTDRAEALLERTALLEFVFLKDGPSTQNIISKIDAIQFDGDTTLAEFDSVEADTGSSLLKIVDDALLETEAISINKFTSLLIPTPSGDMGVSQSNRFRVKNILELEDVKKIIQKDYGRFVWSSDARQSAAGQEEVYILYYLDADPNNPQLTGQVVEEAVADIYNGQPIVRLGMNSEGTKTWSVITSRVGDRVAIVLDNKVHMAPFIRSKITDGRTQVEGLDDMEEAKDIAIVLRAGKLPAPIKKVYGHEVGPALGQDSVDKGTKAILVGLVLVLVFMLIYYKFAGLIADIALIWNLVLVLAVLAMLDATLTLPGIAGL